MLYQLVARECGRRTSEPLSLTSPHVTAIVTRTRVRFVHLDHSHRTTMPETTVAIPVPSKDPKKKKEEDKDVTADGKPEAKPSGDAKEGEELVRTRCSSSAHIH